MPAQIVTGAFCADYFSEFKIEGSNGAVYTLRVDGTSMLTCDCPAFRFHKGPEYDRECKHTKRLFAEACFWNEQWYDGGSRDLRPEPGSCNYPTIPGESCPHCGGPVCPVKIAV